MTAEKFPAWLAARMRERDMDRIYLASRLGVSDRTISYWLAGEKRPEGAGIILDLAQVFDADAGHLLKRIAGR